MIKLGLLIVAILLGSILFVLFNVSRADDMDCFRLESAQLEYQHAHGLSAKVKARKMVKSLTLLCNR